MFFELLISGLVTYLIHEILSKLVPDFLDRIMKKRLMSLSNNEEVLGAFLGDYYYDYRNQKSSIGKYVVFIKMILTARNCVASSKSKSKIK